MGSEVGRAVVQFLTTAKSPWMWLLLILYLCLCRVLLHIERRWEYLPPKARTRRRPHRKKNR